MKDMVAAYSIDAQSGLLATGRHDLLCFMIVAAAESHYSWFSLSPSGAMLFLSRI